ncbi:MAG: hypothetical protein NC908_04705 [Candidatus Omnitrophica bacterium]|nr:hypothetical protein [Candidatus Omnitrophota bacterium]
MEISSSKKGGWGFVRRSPGEKPNYPILEATVAAHNLSWSYVWNALRKYGPVEWKRHLPKETRIHNLRFLRTKRALATAVRQAGTSSPVQKEAGSPAENIFSDQHHINIHLLRQFINGTFEMFPEEMRRSVRPVLKGSAVFLADENGNVDTRMIEDIDIAFEVEGSKITGEIRQDFAQNLHRLCAKILGGDQQLKTWSPDHEHELPEIFFHEFIIKAPNGKELKVSITPTVSENLVGDIIQHDILPILTDGPLDNWGCFPGYDKAIKRYLLVLYYLEGMRFRVLRKDTNS